MATRYRSLIVLTVVLFAQLLLMAWQLRRDQDIPLVRNTVVYIVAPIQRALGNVARSIRGVWDSYVGLRGTYRQNESLNRELDEIKMENHRLREQAEQGRRLQVLFDLREQLPLPTLAAQVLSAGSSETARLVMIDKGAEDGLKPDLPVLVPDGVVGKVLHVFPRTAQVLLITDPYSGVACLLENSRAHGILKGRNEPLSVLEYVPNGDEVKPGQRVFTSGEDRIYPKGLPVGVVVEAKPGPEFQRITVQPLAGLNRLEEVLVILQSGGEVANFPVASNGSAQPAAAPSSSPDTAPNASPVPSPVEPSVTSGIAPARLANPVASGTVAPVANPAAPRPAPAAPAVAAAPVAPAPQPSTGAGRPPSNQSAETPQVVPESQSTEPPSPAPPQ